MSALLLGLLLATQPVSPSTPTTATTTATTTEAPAAAEPAAPELPATTTPPATTTEAEDATPSSPSTSTTSSTSSPPPAVAAAPSMRGPVGVGLLAVGASLAAGGTVAFTLVEAVSAPDRRSNPPSATVERFTTISGFLGVAIASVSAVLVVIGAGLTLSDSGDGAVPNA